VATISQPSILLNLTFTIKKDNPTAACLPFHQRQWGGKYDVSIALPEGRWGVAVKILEKYVCKRV